MLTEARDVVTFFTRQQINCGLLAEQQEVHHAPGLKKDVATRFSSKYTMLDSLAKNKAALAGTVVLPRFKANLQRASTIKERCLDDEWWSNLEFARDLLEPIALAINMVQADNCTQADAYWILRDLETALESMMGDEQDQGRKQLVAVVLGYVQERMKYGKHPGQTLAALLHPKYRHRRAEVPQADRLDAEYLCQVLASKVLTPNTDPETKGTRPWIADNFGDVARQQFAYYRNKLGAIGLDEASFMAGLTEEPTPWWLDYGAECQLLMEVALRVLCIPAAAAAGERVFSALKHIWSDKRACMLMGRAAMLSYVYFNKRVIDRLDAVPTAADWDEFYRWLEEQPVDQAQPQAQPQVIDIEAEAADGDAGAAEPAAIDAALFARAAAMVAAGAMPRGGEEGGEGEEEEGALEWAADEDNAGTPRLQFCSASVFVFAM